VVDDMLAIRDTKTRRRLAKLYCYERHVSGGTSGADMQLNDLGSS